MNHKRIERLWRRERLKVPKKQPKRRELWLNDGFCVRLRPRYKDHVWSYDFVQDRTSDDRSFRMLVIMNKVESVCRLMSLAGSRVKTSWSDSAICSFSVGPRLTFAVTREPSSWQSKSEVAGTCGCEDPVY